MPHLVVKIFYSQVSLSSSKMTLCLSWGLFPQIKASEEALNNICIRYVFPNKCKVYKVKLE